MDKPQKVKFKPPLCPHKRDRVGCLECRIITSKVIRGEK